jgi:hypothetical protein
MITVYTVCVCGHHGSGLGGSLKVPPPHWAGQGHQCSSMREQAGGKKHGGDKRADRGRGIGNDVRGSGEVNKVKGRQNLKAKRYLG